MATGATDINSWPLSYFRDMGQDLILGNNPDTDIILDLGSKQVIHISLFIIILTSSDPPLSQAH